MSYKVNLPSALREAIEQVSTAMHSDSLHHLLPSQRLRIYRVLDAIVENPPHVNKIQGNLGILNAQYVLPIWERITPIWNSQALFDEAHRQLSPEHLQDLQDRYILAPDWWESARFQAVS